MARLIVILEDGNEFAFELREGQNSVGTDQNNDFSLFHDSISSVHCMVTLTNGTVVLRDLGSAYGTFIGKEKVVEAEIEDGTVFHIGQIPVTLRLREEVADVKIPERKFEALPQQSYNEEGHPMCFTFPDQLASYECRKCTRFFSLDALNNLGLKGGARHSYCPNCGAECSPYRHGDGKEKGALSQFASAFMKSLYSSPKKKDD